ncbi:MAG: hypothetical protein IKM46_04270 [Clostridia bacterium]|nr:hypothetical protein [Clostridia bacterium]
MKISTTALSKIKTISFILLLALTVAVNAVTVSIIVKYYTEDNSASYDATDTKEGEKTPVVSNKVESSVFGDPEKIILHGDGKAVTLKVGDEDFEDILKINEHRTVFVSEYMKSSVFDENTLDVYYMEFSYAEPHLLSLDGVGEFDVTSIILVLTGVQNGKIKFESGGETHVVEKLSFDPELLVKVVDNLE